MTRPDALRIDRAKITEIDANGAHTVTVGPCIITPLRVAAPEPTEDVCLDCMEGDHRACRDNAGFMHDDTPERCGCHLTEHALDNREPLR